MKKTFVKTGSIILIKNACGSSLVAVNEEYEITDIGKNEDGDVYFNLRGNLNLGAGIRYDEWYPENDDSFKVQ